MLAGLRRLEVRPSLLSLPQFGHFHTGMSGFSGRNICQLRQACRTALQMMIGIRMAVYRSKNQLPIAPEFARASYGAASEK